MSAHVCPQTIRTLYDSGSLFIPFGDISEHDGSCVIYNTRSTTLWTLRSCYECVKQGGCMERILMNMPICFLGEAVREHLGDH